MSHRHFQLARFASTTVGAALAVLGFAHWSGPASNACGQQIMGRGNEYRGEAAPGTSNSASESLGGRGDEGLQGLENDFEPEPTLLTSALLPESMLRGDNFRMAAEAPTRGDQFLFTLLTTRGSITARGLVMAELRVREMQALERLDEVAGEPHLWNGVLQTLVDTPRGAALIVTDPIGSLKRGPKGLKMMIASRTDRAERQAGPPPRRWLADAVGCDPETRNPLLKRSLDRISQQRLTGKAIARLALIAAPAPGLGLLSLSVDIKKMTMDHPPSELNRLIEQELENDGLPESLRRRFCEQSVFTTTQRLMLMEHYRSLRDVVGRERLIETAASAFDEAEGVETIFQAKLCADLHQAAPIAEIGDAGWVAVALRDGRRAAISTGDLLYRSPELVQQLQIARQVLGPKPILLITSGRMTIQAKATIERAGFQPIDRGQISDLGMGAVGAGIRIDEDEYEAVPFPGPDR